MREFADPNSTPDLQRDREQEFLARLHDRLAVVLDGAIASAIGDRIAALQKSRNYRIFADKAILGWQLLYCEGLSQREIVDRLGMTNQSQVSRVLNPKELLSRVRFRTLEGLLEAILEFRDQLGFGGDRLSPEALENIQAGLEEFIDSQVFEEAFTEMKAGNNRSFESLYAKRLQFFLQKCQ
jgi:transcriptional regulator with XRE-family HTH domain